MRRSLFDLVLIVLVAALGGFLWHQREEAPIRPVPTPSPVQGGITLDGVRPGMLREQVHEALGHPTGQGQLQVGTPSQVGMWEEWGSTTLTWEGRPTVSYRATGEVLAVCGRRLRGADWVLDVGDPAIFPRPLGSPSSRDETHAVFALEQGDLTATLQGDKITRMVWSDPHRNP